MPQQRLLDFLLMIQVVHPVSMTTSKDGTGISVDSAGKRWKKPAWSPYSKKANFRKYNRFSTRIANWTLNERGTLPFP